MRLFRVWLCLMLVAFSGQARELNVALADVDYGPFYYQENNEIHGISVEILAHVLQEVQATPQYNRLPWSRVLEELKDGRQDLVTVLYLTRSRRSQYAYVSPAYLRDSINLLCHKPCNLAFTGSLADVHGRYVGVTRNFSYGEKLDHEEGIRRQTVEREPELFRLLSQGKLKLAVASRITFLWRASRQDLLRKVEVMEPALDSVGIHFVLGRKVAEDKAFTTEFSQALRDYLQSPAYQKKLKEYQLEQHSILQPVFADTHIVQAPR